MSWSATRTLIGLPSASSTAAYWLKIAMPGPMMAWDRSTGATGLLMPPRVMSISASGSTALSSRMNSRRLTSSGVSVALAADEDDAGGKSVGTNSD